MDDPIMNGEGLGWVIQLVFQDGIHVGSPICRTSGCAIIDLGYQARPVLIYQTLNRSANH